jgi:hypothetical protein
VAALAGRARRVIAKLPRTKCRNKDLADTVAVDLTARPVVAIHPVVGSRPVVVIHPVVGSRLVEVIHLVVGSRLAEVIHPVAGSRLVEVIHPVVGSRPVEAIHPLVIHPVVAAILLQVGRPLEATVRPDIRRVRLPATHRNPGMAVTRGRPLEATLAPRRRRTRPCFGSAWAVAGCCCSALVAGSRVTCTCGAKSAL